MVAFLDLADYQANPHNANLVLFVDFLLIMVVAAQERVFSKESANHVAGDNKSIYRKGDFTLSKNNPYYDFISEQRLARG